MKQKYVITIAGLEMTVAADAEATEVEKIVGIIDSRMNEILAASHGSYSKTEAALLCGLGFCSELSDAQKENTKLTADLKDANDTLATLKTKLAEQKAEIDRLKNDNDMLNAILERAAANNKPNLQPKEDPQIMESNNNNDNKKKSGSRIGSMFDLLTFGDV